MLADMRIMITMATVTSTKKMTTFKRHGCRQSNVAKLRCNVGARYPLGKTRLRRCSELLGESPAMDVTNAAVGGVVMVADAVTVIGLAVTVSLLSNTHQPAFDVSW